MSEEKLRKALIRLAHAKPELQGDLLPLLKKGYGSRNSPQDLAWTLGRIVEDELQKRGVGVPPGEAFMWEVASFVRGNVQTNVGAWRKVLSPVIDSLAQRYSG